MPINLSTETDTATAKAEAIAAAAADAAAKAAATLALPWDAREKLRINDPVSGWVGPRTASRNYSTEKKHIRFLEMGDSFGPNVWNKAIPLLGQRVGFGGTQPQFGVTTGGGVTYEPSGSYDWTRSICGRWTQLPAAGTYEMSALANVREIILFHTAETGAGTYKIEEDIGAGYVAIDASLSSINTDNGSATPTAVAVTWRFATIRPRKIRITGLSGISRIWGFCWTGVPKTDAGTLVHTVVDVFTLATGSLDISGSITVPQQFYDVVFQTLQPDIVSWKTNDNHTQAQFTELYKRTRKARSYTLVSTGANNDLRFKFSEHLVGLDIRDGGATGIEVVTPGYYRVTVNGTITATAFRDLFNGFVPADMMTCELAEGDGSGNVTPRTPVVMEHVQPDWAFISGHPVAAFPGPANGANDIVLAEFAWATRNAFINSRASHAPWPLMPALGDINDGLHSARANLGQLEYIRILRALLAAGGQMPHRLEGIAGPLERTLFDAGLFAKGSYIPNTINPTANADKLYEFHLDPAPTTAEPHIFIHGGRQNRAKAVINVFTGAARFLLNRSAIPKNADGSPVIVPGAASYLDLIFDSFNRRCIRFFDTRTLGVAPMLEGFHSAAADGSSTGTFSWSIGRLGSFTSAEGFFHSAGGSITAGTTSGEGVTTATIGSLRQSTTASAPLEYKATGTGNTGWRAVPHIPRYADESTGLAAVSVGRSFWSNATNEVITRLS